MEIDFLFIKFAFMEKLREFFSLEEDKGVLQKFRNTFFVFGIYTVWAYLIYHLIDLVRPAQIQLFPFIQQPLPAEIFLKTCLLAPIWEELFFRFVPIKLCKKFKLDKSIVWTIVIGTSIYFGNGHPSMVGVFAQGMLGFLLSWLYIKNNSLILNILCHFLWNFFCFTGFQYLAN